MFVCRQVWPSPLARKAFFLCIVFLCCYTIPLCSISVCYAMIGYRVSNRELPGGESTVSPAVRQSTYKALKMISIVVAYFALSWLPLYAANIRMTFQSEKISETERDILITIVIPIAQWLGSSNSCINPIIYCFCSKKWRSHFTAMIGCASRQQTVLEQQTIAQHSIAQQSIAQQSIAQRSSLYGGSSASRNGSTRSRQLKNNSRQLQDNATMPVKYHVIEESRTGTRETLL